MLGEQIRFVTRHFYQLQGLRLIPIALFLVWYEASRRNWLDWLPGRPVERPGDLGNAWGPAALILAIGTITLIESRYRERYGSVLQLPRAKRQFGIGMATIAVLILLPVDRLLEWPVLLSPLVIALALGAVVRTDGPFRKHYVVPAAAWGFISVLPLLGFNREYLSIVYTLVGSLSLAVCGIGDHFLIVRTMCAPGRRLDVAKSAAV